MCIGSSGVEHAFLPLGSFSVWVLDLVGCVQRGGVVLLSAAWIAGVERDSGVSQPVIGVPRW